MDIYNDPTATVQGEFSDGDPLAVPPVPRTVLRDIWPNMIQRELINLVEGAGLTLDGGDYTQVLQAVLTFSRISTPPAAVQAFATSTVPTGWLECDGSAVSRTTYDALFAAIGTTYGAGDRSTTFNLPDLRGEFIRGWDHGRGVDSGRTFGSIQSDAFRSHIHDGLQASGGSDEVFVGTDGTGQDKNGRTIGASAVTDTRPGIQTVEAGGDETRPRNIAMMYCIKY